MERPPRSRRCIGFLSTAFRYRPTAGQKILASAVVAIVVLSAAMIVFQTDDTHHDNSFTIIHTNDTHCFYDGDGGVGRMIAA